VLRFGFRRTVAEHFNIDVELVVISDVFVVGAGSDCRYYVLWVSDCDASHLSYPVR